MKLEFFSEGPALVIERELRLLIVADLHFGIEADLAIHGLHFKSRTSERLERLMKIIDLADPDMLVLLGDVKHCIPSLSRQEYLELPVILETIRNRIPLKVFPGNHDTGIEHYLLESELQPRDGTIIDGTGYLHGHMYPSPELSGHLMVAGHHHPLLQLKDEVGCATQAPVYMRACLEKERWGKAISKTCTPPSLALLVPAFNEIAGYNILQIFKKPFSPVSRCMKKEGTEIILADGTYIGPLSSVCSDETD